MRYSIEGQELTDIADALRSKIGETEYYVVEEFVPDTQVMKTPNATGFDSHIGEYSTSSKKWGEIKFEGASRIKVKIAYELLGSHYLYMDGGSYSSYYQMTENKKMVTKTGMSEFEFDNDTVTFYMDAVDYNNHDMLGFYAECTAYDANGNMFGSVQSVTKEKLRTFTSAEMPQAIYSLNILPEEAFIISGDCKYKFSGDGWNWFLDKYKDMMVIQDISDAQHMFYSNQGIKNIDLEFDFVNGGCAASKMFQACTFLESVGDIDFQQTSYKDMSEVFISCLNLKHIGTLKNIYPATISGFFKNCNKLRHLPVFENLNLSRIKSYANSNATDFCAYCYSLREVPEDFLKQFYQLLCTGYYYSFLAGTFNNCYALDEIRGLNPQTGTMTSNMFSNTFTNCYRVKNIIFATQDDGTPYSVNWKNQTITLTQYIGYAANDSILKYNSGLTEDTRIKYHNGVANYDELKDHPDSFTYQIEFSRYNHDSAVNTINSLPDTSAYLATAGGSNTIKFKGASGSKTDGGAINTLTEEEIAIATAKGWTVTFV